MRPTQQNLRDVGLDPWVWGTVIRWSTIHYAYLLRNGELHFDQWDMGKERWDEWPMCSEVVRRSWQRAS